MWGLGKIDKISFLEATPYNHFNGFLKGSCSKLLVRKVSEMKKTFKAMEPAFKMLTERKRGIFGCAVCRRGKLTTNPQLDWLGYVKRWRQHKLGRIVENVCPSLWLFYDLGQHRFEESMQTCFTRRTLKICGSWKRILRGAEWISRGLRNFHDICHQWMHISVCHSNLGSICRGGEQNDANRPQTDETNFQHFFASSCLRPI